MRKAWIRNLISKVFAILAQFNKALIKTETSTRSESWTSDISNQRNRVKIQPDQTTIFWQHFGDDSYEDREHFPKHKFQIGNKHFKYEEGFFTERVIFLREGQSFGELALKDEQSSTRKATVTCETDAFFATLDRESYHKCLAKIDQKRQNAQIEFLKKLGCFKNQSRTAILKFTFFLTKLKFRRGQTVYRTGDDSDRVFIVLRGEFELSSNLPKVLSSNRVTQLG